MWATYATCHIGGVVSVPTIDVSALLDPAAPPDEVRRTAGLIGDACRDVGFLQIVGHGVDPALRRRLHDAAVAFFSQDDDTKRAISMDRGGAAWRGWFPLGDELTAGVPDDKEGLYFGTELPTDDPRVRAGLALHGPNQFPAHPAELRPLVLDWMQQLTDVGLAVLSGIAVSFGLEHSWFDRWCADPTVLFRIFHYPPPPPGFAGTWGVAEHTDYGLLTLLVQDDTGGLEVRVEDRWVDVPPTPDAIVCNLGDMLERVTGGRFRSTAHRVRLPDRDRYSFPLFLDPAWDAELTPLPGCEPTERALAEAADGRWDGRSVFDVGGPYGDYLLDKVSSVFPELFDRVVGTQDSTGRAPGSVHGRQDP
jgi:isopenicillin N synthase-like dioxygenase